MVNIKIRACIYRRCNRLYLTLYLIINHIVLKNFTSKNMLIYKIMRKYNIIMIIKRVKELVIYLQTNYTKEDVEN